MRSGVSYFLFLFAILIRAQAAVAELKFGFADVNLNHLDWGRGVEQKSDKRDFTYLELEGGAVFDWGELYGFFDIENVAKTGEEVRTAAKGSLNYYLGDSGLSLYAHVYNFSAFGFSEQNRVLGFGYNLGNQDWWFKPFLGFHDVTQAYFGGANGYMAGWVFGRFFSVGGVRFLLADWHEHEFARARRYAAGNGGKTSSHNGALSLWWIATPHFTPGVQWRYAVDKLGTGGSLDAWIYTLKYVF